MALQTNASATRWDELNRRILREVETCDELYRPTNFWGPGIRALLRDLDEQGLETFKSWRSADTWFYPTYGERLTTETIDAAFELVQRDAPRLTRRSFETALSGERQARRDFDAVRLAWDQTRWPFDLDGWGESEVGRPAERFHLTGSKRAAWTRPYLNYLLCLAALSRHVDMPPTSFLEIGGGYGVLGEILLSREVDARYVNVDIPPLLTVASYYLDSLFPGRMTVYDEAIPEAGPIQGVGSACLPSWRIGDVADSFDAFLNSYSFQEMEPAVVGHYIARVAAMDVAWVVSLNSRQGKASIKAGHAEGVIDPVTSADIVAMFGGHGYELVEAYGDPLIHAAGELAVLRRSDVIAKPASALARRPDGRWTNLAAKASRPDPSPRQPPAGWSGSLRGALTDWVPPILLRRLRALRRRRAASSDRRLP